MSLNGLCSCIKIVCSCIKKMIMSGHNLGKRPPRKSAPLEKVPPSSPKFEISAPGGNSMICGT